MPTALARGKSRAFHARAQQLAQLELNYQFHDSFLSRDAEDEFLAEPPDESKSGRRSRLPREMPAHLARLCEHKLFSVAEERHRFRRMNYARYRADVLRRKLDTSQPQAEAVKQIDRLLAVAAHDRNEIITANVRLVMSIIKKFANEVLTFDELLSDGIDVLMRAADKFDFSRGFRFSTYATTAIRHTLYRLRHNAYRDRDRMHAGDQAELADQPEPADASPDDDLCRQQRRQALKRLLRRLGQRERYILSRRYGLDADGASQTLRSLARDLGVCKERVRQLEMRAKYKIRTMAQEMNLALNDDV